MCKICADLIKDKITSSEATRNLKEIIGDREVIPDKHVFEVIVEIEKKIQRENE